MEAIPMLYEAQYVAGLLVIGSVRMMSSTELTIWFHELVCNLEVVSFWFFSNPINLPSDPSEWRVHGPGEIQFLIIWSILRRLDSGGQPSTFQRKIPIKQHLNLLIDTTGRTLLSFALQVNATWLPEQTRTPVHQYHYVSLYHLQPPIRSQHGV